MNGAGPLVAPADLDAVLHNVEPLSPRIADAAQRGEHARRVDADLLDLLTSAGLFRMTMPTDWDGIDLSLAAQADVVERLARADAAVAWTVTAGSGAGLAVRGVAPDIALDLFPHPDMLLCSALVSDAVGERVGGMYRIAGQWRAASGIHEADVAALAFAVTEDGRRTGETRVAVLPTAHLEQAPEAGLALAAVGWAQLTPAAGQLNVPDSHTYEGPTRTERLRARILAAAIAVGLMRRFATGENEARCTLRALS